MKWLVDVVSTSLNHLAELLAILSGMLKAFVFYLMKVSKHDKVLD